ncbi:MULTISPECIES: Crp/Fnr family transcriptional regulator [Thalassospira]|uniref:Crp/Fnr family transcriptional regulator n=1 Tax=Thalassospira indica TaxID=1891279 RepID=A0ABN5NQG9_9PROT|nr:MULTISPECIES: Crp/Fnr family transcriptional regulator [Thalassospira]OAZ14272.1 Crp/Fnr family transcriptional regulator [Thalassospira profundimaris]BDW90191.1 Crp/Fnr family transcriptional regulator [Thalassospira tepidiphila]AXO16747.1 Crp/Fnr family transcriptional regulator [Thalassospira indica]KZC99187.1 Crp/Fnr family transcriptional regulator [Thalassospira sp. MCCC 1A02898]ONH88519.1 Crp/Fnr family transcriptional regulator [Thalassospira sp. MCCC 1A02803]
MVSSTAAVSKRLKNYIDLTEQELDTLSRMIGPSRMISAGGEIVHEGQSGHRAFILQDGWVMSYKLLPEGARQIIDFQVPGDFLGLRSLLLRTSDHSFEAVTDVLVGEVKAQDMLSAFSSAPRLAMSILWSVSCDEAMVVEHLVNIGRRSAIERTAHFLLELGARLRSIGVGDAQGYPCPLSQYQLADTLGLSAIHINRVLRQLREQNLVTFQKGVVQFNDLKKLTELAEFEMGYLDQVGPVLVS